METIGIGRLSELTGVKVPTIRFYETIGLLPAPPRTDGNRRRFGPEHVARLTFIRRSRAFGLPMAAIRDLLILDLNPDQPCAPATEIARTFLVEIDQRIAELTALKARLQTIVGQCTGARVETCAILKALHE